MISKKLFYASKVDLLEGIANVERNLNLKYVEFGLFDEPAPRQFLNGSELPNIGASLSGKFIQMPTYLVLPADTETTVVEVPQRRGGIKFSIDCRANPRAITFTPSGLFHGSCLIYGELAPCPESSESLQFYKIFAKYFFSNFKKIKAFSVGVDAMNLHVQGVRLAANHNADVSTDLAV
jgi:hypothetical protein